MTYHKLTRRGMIIGWVLALAALASHNCTGLFALFALLATFFLAVSTILHFNEDPNKVAF